MLEEPSVEIDWTSAPEDATHCLCPKTHNAIATAHGIRTAPFIWYSLHSGVVERWTGGQWKAAGVRAAFVRQNPNLFIKRPAEVQS